MPENVFYEHHRVVAQFLADEWSTASGRPVAIGVQLINLSPEGETLKIILTGLPTEWLDDPSHYEYLGPHETKDIAIVVTPPPPPEARSGRYPFQIDVCNADNGATLEQIDSVLTVATREVPGRIGILLDTVHYSVAPGERVDISFLVSNQGPDPDRLTLSVQGIPLSWVSASTSIASLGPGEEEEMVVVLNPPLSPEARAGRHTFQLRFDSQLTPNAPVIVDCLLTIEAFTDFFSSLSPEVIQDGELIRIYLENVGNIRDTYSLAFSSPGTRLVFEPVIEAVDIIPDDAPRPDFVPEQRNWLSLLSRRGQGSEINAFRVRVDSGASVNVDFQVRAHERRLFGPEVASLFTLLVRTSSGQGRSHPGQVYSQGLLPNWLLIVSGIILLAGICLSSYLTYLNIMP